MLKFQVMPLGAYQTNCYILWDEDSDDCVVIDPGYQPEVVLAQTEKLGKNIVAILLTHGHFDHVGAVKDIVSETGCQVYLHPADLSMPPQMTAGPLYYTHTYGEGDTLQLADLQLYVMHTPGHTPGSVCLRCQEHIFSGDTLFQGSCGRTDLPGGDWKTILQSLKRLAAMDGNYRVHPGHGPSTTLAEEKLYNPYMQA